MGVVADHWMVPSPYELKAEKVCWSIWGGGDRTGSPPTGNATLPIQYCWDPNSVGVSATGGRLSPAWGPEIEPC